MNTVGSGLCLALGAVISFVVSYLKRFTWVSNHSKLVALLVSIVVGTATAWLAVALAARSIATQFDLSNVVSCILVQFAGAVTTHEVIVQPVQDSLIKKQT